MMLIYRGKLSWFQYVVDEGYTLILLEGWGVGKPVLAYWQWTVDHDGHKKVNQCQSTFITGSVAHNTSTTLSWSDSHYSFDTTVNELEPHHLNIRIRNPTGDSKLFAVTQVAKYHRRPLLIPSYRVYVGKMDWHDHVKNEMLVVFAPGEMDVGELICAFWGWTADDPRAQKTNVDCVTTIARVKDQTYGQDIVFHHGESNYYTLTGSVHEGDGTMRLSMQNPSGDIHSGMVLKLHASSAPSSRQNHDTSAQSSAIITNGTGGPISLTMNDATPAGRASTLAGVGFILAGLGCIPLQRPLRVGIQVMGMGVAVSGVINTLEEDNSDGTLVLFDGESMSRTTKAVLPTFTPGNTARVFQCSMKTPGYLSILMGEIDSMDSQMREILPEDLVRLFTIHVPRAKALTSFRTFPISGFRPVMHGRRIIKEKDIFNIKLSNGDMLMNPDPDDGSITIFPSYSAKHEDRHTPMFELSQASHFTLVEGDPAHSHSDGRAIWPPSLKKIDSHLRLWVLERSGAFEILDHAGNAYSGRNLGKFSTIHAAEDKISGESYAFYTYDGDGVLRGYKGKFSHGKIVVQNNSQVIVPIRFWSLLTMLTGD